MVARDRNEWKGFLKEANTHMSCGTNDDDDEIEEVLIWIFHWLDNIEDIPLTCKVRCP